MSKLVYESTSGHQVMFVVRPNPRILYVAVHSHAAKTEGGLLVSSEDSGREQTLGTVVAAGDDCYHIQQGDTVQFNKFSGSPQEGWVLSGQKDLPVSERSLIKVLRRDEVLSTLHVTSEA